MTHPTDDLDVGLDFTVTRVRQRRTDGGAWVNGRISGHRFEALVFAAHAENPEWERGESRISKLWLQRLEDRGTAFSWDRGADVEPQTPIATAIVDFLAAGLAEHIFG